MSKIALVTGGSRGIGRGVAEYLHEHGFEVAITSRQEADEDAQTKFLCIVADNSSAEQRARAVDAVLQKYGRIDVLVNNAGIAPRVRADLLDMGEDSMRELLDVNLVGPFFLTQLVAKKMIEQGSGTIVNITSMSSDVVSTNRGEYCVSKAGLSMMTKLFAVRLAEYGIPVYEIRPGIIATDMTSKVRDKYDALISGGITPIKRWGYPEDIAKAVYALSLDLLPFSTGEVINVDGGFHLQRL